MSILSDVKEIEAEVRRWTVERHASQRPRQRRRTDSRQAQWRIHNDQHHPPQGYPHLLL